MISAEDPCKFKNFILKKYIIILFEFFSYLPETSKECVDANMFWYGPDRIDGIFFDTGSTRGSINYSQEEEDRDISSHTMLATYAKNLYRDHVLGKRDENSSFST